MALNNPFDHKNRLKKVFEEEERQVKSQLENLKIIANDLLGDQRYRQFTKLVEEGEKNLVNLFLRYREDDPYKFKSKVSDYLIEIGVYRKIVNSVNELANPTVGKPPNLMGIFKKKMYGILEGIK